MSRNPLHNRLISIIEPVLHGAGLELVDVRFLLEQGGWVLRVQIDTPIAEWTNKDQVPSDRVSLSDCENMSRELSAVLDVEDPIPQAYHLEISSPGIDRPLRVAEHYRHFVGTEAKIQLAIPLHLGSAPGGTSASGSERRNFKGILRGVSDDNLRVTIECDHQPFELAIADIDQAKLIPDWDAVMHGKSGIGAASQAKPIKPGHRPSQKHQEQSEQPHKPHKETD